MQDELQKMDEICRRVGVSYQVARSALQEAGGDLATALAIAEQDRDTAAGGLAAAGMAFMDELKEFVSRGEIRKLRVKLGNRTLKEFPVCPTTALAMLGIAVAALVVTKLRIEVERGTGACDDTAAPGNKAE